MSKSRLSKSKSKNEDFVISVLSIGLGIVILALLVAVDQLQWFSPSDGYGASRREVASFNRPVISDKVVRQ